MNSGEREALAALADALLAAQPKGRPISDGGLVFTYGQAQRAVITALTRTQPATGDAAREILARFLPKAFERDGNMEAATNPGCNPLVPTNSALRAIESALRSPGGEDPRIAAVREVIERGGYRLVNGKPFTGEFAHGQKCDHDQFGFQDCIACYDDALLAALDPGKGEA